MPGKIFGYRRLFLTILMKDLDPSIGERNLLHDALLAGIRIDGRRLQETRPLVMTFPGGYGQVQVEMGQTRILAQVSCQVARPYPDRPYEGFLNINTEISPMASTAFEVGRSSNEEILINRLIEKSIRRSRAIDTEALCIVAGEKVWSLRVDIHFLDHDGNLADCASIACIAALMHFRKPDVTVIGDEVTVHPVDERVPIPLSIHHIPISTTFAFFEGGSVMIMDPNKLEERLAQGTMTITMNKYQELCVLSKDGGVPLGATDILNCTRLALSKTLQVTDSIQAAIIKNSPKEDKGF